MEARARRRAAAVERDTVEAAALLVHLRGRTVLDVGGGDGYHAAAWRAMGGFEPTVLDKKDYCADDLARLRGGGVRLINQDFFTCSVDDGARYDTVISLRAMNPEGALDRELRMAGMRVINMMLLPLSKEGWGRGKQQYIEWLEGLMRVIDCNRGRLDAHIILLDDDEEIVQPRDFRDRLSLADLMNEWRNDRMCVWQTDFYTMLIVVDKMDKKFADAEDIRLPVNPRKRVYG